MVRRVHLAAPSRAEGDAERLAGFGVPIPIVQLFCLPTLAVTGLGPIIVGEIVEVRVLGACVVEELKDS